MIDWNRVKNELVTKERLMAGATLEAAEACLEEAAGLAHPKIIFVEKKILNISPDSIEIEGSAKFPGKKLASYFRNASSVNIFLVTIGNALEDRASFLMNQKEELHGYLLDSIGSLAVESLAEGQENVLRKGYASRDLSVSMRFSPGYCDWPIEDQFKLDRIIDFSKAGVALTNSCMMVPRKSISSMVGVGPKGVFTKTGSQCTICSKKDCDYRRAS